MAAATGKKPRRPRGNGKLYQHKSGRDKGKWLCAIWVTDPATGERRYKTFTRATASAANNAAKEYERLHGDVAVKANALTVSMAIDRYIRAHSVNRRTGEPLRSSTLATRRHTANRIAADPIGNLRVQKLTDQDVNEMVQRMRTGGWTGTFGKISPSYQLQCRSLLSRAVEYAVENGFVTRNVVAKSKPVPVKNRKSSLLTETQVDEILDAAKARGPQDYALICLLNMGLRRGEALGLLWSDMRLDAEMPMLLVQAQLVREQGGPPKRVPFLKTEESERELPMTDDAVDALRVLKATRTEPTAHDFVFLSRAGTPLDPSNAYHLIKRIGRDAGVEHLKPHSFRHHAITKMLRDNVQIAHVMAVVGHRDHRMTLRTYNHLQPEDLQGAAKMLNRHRSVFLAPAPSATMVASEHE